MQGKAYIALLLGLLAGGYLFAEPPSPACLNVPSESPAAEEATTSADAGPTPKMPWLSLWGVGGLRIFADGPKVAPNGERYHPSFTLDLSPNFWLWREQGVYLFGDFRFWAERPENGVTNGRDGGLGFSKRQFDLSGGVAWNYAGFCEARVSGYSFNNLNRGTSLTQPTGINDGALLENRFYLSGEYTKLGEPGYDVTRVSFLSVGFFPTKEMVGNDGVTFQPDLFLRAYLTWSLGDWPCYVFGDFQYIGERWLNAKLLLVDVGLAARPFAAVPQCEFRLGVENTADLRESTVLNLWYISARFVF
jgi:hypothetical protein